MFRRDLRNCRQERRQPFPPIPRSAFRTLHSSPRSPQLPIAPDSPTPRVRITPDSSRQLSEKRGLSGPIGSYRELSGPKSNFLASHRSTQSTNGKLSTHCRRRRSQRVGLSCVVLFQETHFRTTQHALVAPKSDKGGSRITYPNFCFLFSPSHIQ
jgi:hypothetical protein